MTRPLTPRPQQTKPLPLRPQDERLDSPNGRTVPVMIGGVRNFGE